MTLKEYLKSSVFGVQLLMAITLIGVIGYFFMHWLTFTTDHGNEITVPDLRKMSEQQVEDAVDELNLEYVLLDSVDYNSQFPKHTVVEQDPLPGSKVKVNRKIYIKINSSGFTMVRIPNIIEKTYRQAVPTLKSLGLEEGTISYKPYIGKDMVLEMHWNGKKLNPGDKVFKSSKIDLVLGDGNVGFDETQLDTTAVPEPIPADGQ
ncbi:MAG: PASTA domain-containing protein [Flavobacterium sp.]|nr:PASTA domain-containing protein [Flavobacterium sp.]